jgi:acyl-CoA synthetase (AMP-forming)/AMP-acid ligase II
LSDHPPTLWALLSQRVQQQGEGNLFTFVSGKDPAEARCTYAELEAQACAIAAELQSRCQPQDRIFLLHPPGLDYIAAFFGCLYAGMIAVPAYPPDPNRLDRTLPRLLGILKDSDAKLVLTTTMIAGLAPALIETWPELGVAEWIASDAIPLSRAKDWHAPGRDPKSVAFLQYTSGSTGKPKGVVLTQENLLANQRALQHAYGTVANDVGVGWVPPYHDMGLIGFIIHPVFYGGRCVLMSPLDFLRNPTFWLSTVSTHHAALSGGPNFAYDLCTRKISAEARATLDLSSWRVAFNGAERLRASTLEVFADTFAPCGFRRSAFAPGYGLAEATLVVTGGPPEKVYRTTEADGVLWVSSGQRAEGQDYRIVDPEKVLPCADGGVGEVWVKGPSVAAGYWRSPEETRQSFQAFLANGDGPYLRSGDLGFEKGGDLYLVGRLRDTLIVRGRNVYPEDLEATVEQAHPAVRAGCCIAFSFERESDAGIAVVAEIERRSADGKPSSSSTEEKDRRTVDAAGAWPTSLLKEVADGIRKEVSRKHELRVDEVVLIRSGTIPKTTSGKLQRGQCRQLFLQGQLETLSSTDK